MGWANYERIVSNGELLLLLRNNLIFVFAVPGILLISLVVTVLLFEEVPGLALSARSTTCQPFSRRRLSAP